MRNNYSLLQDLGCSIPIGTATALLLMIVTLILS
jgi:hypothetical protein